jgi:hypothetical protein
VLFAVTETREIIITEKLSAILKRKKHLKIEAKRRGEKLSEA